MDKSFGFKPVDLRSNPTRILLTESLLLLFFFFVFFVFYLLICFTFCLFSLDIFS